MTNIKNEKEFPRKQKNLLNDITEGNKQNSKHENLHDEQFQQQ